MSNIIELSGSLNDGQLIEIKEYCKQEFKEQLDIRPSPRALGIDTISSISALSSATGAIIAVISLCFQIRQQTRPSNWSLARLKDEISTECARQGLPEFQIRSINNFKALADASHEPCKLRVFTSEGIELDMYVFNDGSKYSIRII